MIEGAVLLVRLLAALGALQLAGCGLLAGLCPTLAGLSRLERQALSFGSGALVLTWWMLALSLLGLPFHLPMVAGPPLGLAAGGLLWQKFAVRKKTQPASGFKITKNQKPKTKNRISPWDWLFLGFLAVLFLYAALRAVLYPVWAWDALATWGFKGKAFFLERGLDFGRFRAHNYYPNLVPLLLTYLYLCLGQVNDHLVKLVFPLFGAALLALLYSFLLRLGLDRTRALGLTTFSALNGVTFIVHLYIAYADLALTYYTLGAAGLMYLWLTDRAPSGALALSAAMCAGMAWCKFEGPPLAATVVLAALLTLLWLKHRSRLPALLWPVLGILLGYLPWRLFMQLRRIETGSDHILGFYSQQLFQAVPALLKALFHPKFFGFLWPAALLSLAWLLRKACRGEACPALRSNRGSFWDRLLFNTPALFLALFLSGNLLAILLGYAVAPTSAEEFPFYVRATLDRLVLHITPVAVLLIGEGMKEMGRSEKMAA